MRALRTDGRVGKYFSKDGRDCSTDERDLSTILAQKCPYENVSAICDANLATSTFRVIKCKCFFLGSEMKVISGSYSPHLL